MSQSLPVAEAAVCSTIGAAVKRGAGLESGGAVMVSVRSSRKQDLERSCSSFQLASAEMACKHAIQAALSVEDSVEDIHRSWSRRMSVSSAVNAGSLAFSHRINKSMGLIHNDTTTHAVAIAAMYFRLMVILVQAPTTAGRLRCTGCDNRETCFKVRRSILYSLMGKFLRSVATSTGMHTGTSVFTGSSLASYCS